MKRYIVYRKSKSGFQYFCRFNKAEIMSYELEEAHGFKYYLSAVLKAVKLQNRSGIKYYVRHYKV